MAEYIENLSDPFTTLYEIFYKKTWYKYQMQDVMRDHPNVVDFTYGEKCLYGRVDKKFIPIAVKSWPIVNFKSTANPKQRVGALNFVVAAFEDMNQQFRRGVLTKQISSTDPHLSDLKVVKAYQDPQRAYGNYINTMQDVMNTKFRKQKVIIRDFSQFINVFYTGIERIARHRPITYSAFIKSRFCPMNVSGLVIEIAESDPNNDQEKFNQFVYSPNWKVYLELCSNYGFMVDSNLPWRLVADLESEGMQNYAAVEGINDVFAIFKNYYVNTYSDYFNKFRAFLLNLYNKMKSAIIFEPYTCSDGSVKTKNSSPASYTYEELGDQYSEEYFLRLYFQIRLLEEESTKTDAYKRLFLEDCLKTYTDRGLSAALFVFERIVNLPLDYVGSINYNEMKKKLLADAEAAEKGATVLPSSYSGGY